ncbi:glycosyltransferase family 4 protein [Chryseobacterium fluminis]|uniref:glycosyltransferase family 4 protein n=1 Tax=Chryseobacterium fluminis TaxID=2983606 RepID=UPI00225368CD|nr:glycosyltransferase family 4 protein [Chryseobacterium sp. MMS21-Ot14]UZT99704.1 glycosyltransferase family 4 protein [Chryseobacterium sp. MMS21-Ot14]
MKIIIPLIGAFGKSGGYRVLSQLANFWIKMGNEVTFLSHNNGEDPYFPTDADIMYYDNSGNVESSKINIKPKSVFDFFILRKALKKALDKMEADVVLANHSFTADPLKKSIIKAKKFYYVQAYEPEYFYHRNLKDFILKRASEKSYRLGLNTIVNASMYMDYKGIKTHRVVFPGLDLDIFKPLSKIKNDSKIILGTIGRVEAYKGTSYIIEAFKKLRKSHGEKIELHVAFGEKHLEETEGITVVIPQGDNELAEYYNSLHIYISAGTVQLDAVHYPVIEAMACKTPVITTGYYPSNKNNSWIVPIKNADAIAEEVDHVLRDPDQIKKVKTGYTDIKEFDWNNIAGKMLKYFKE